MQAGQGTDQIRLESTTGAVAVGKGGQGSDTLCPPLRGGRSLHSDPWREGNRVDEAAEAAASTTGGVLRKIDAGPDSNKLNKDEFGETEC